MTLMERIVKQKPEVVTLLKMQYRMNEDIMRFSSEWFYKGQVESAPEVRNRSILDYDIPMLWIDTADMACREEFVGESYGRINKTEARLTIAALQLYFDKIGKERIIEERIDVGIISPYRSQVQFLRQMIKKVSDFLLKTAKRNIEGEITQVEAGQIIDAYYETKEGHDQPEDRKEADKVARRINETINSPTFRFSPEYYIGLHGRLFKDVFAHAGKIREVV